MISLRVRFFLISWPLVVVAIVAVALGAERSAVVELQRLEGDPRAVREDARLAAWVDGVASRWATLHGPEGAAMLAALAGGGDSAPILAVVDATGALRAASDTGLRLLTPVDSLGGTGQFRWNHQQGDGRVTEELRLVPGHLVRDGRGVALGALHLLPRQVVPSPEVAFTSRRSVLRQRIWAVALVAALAAAAAAFLLAGPIVGRVRRLAAAAAAIRRGQLDARVRDNGRDELAALGESFNAMATALAGARQHHRNLVGDVAHELRTPLTNLVGLIEAMQDGLVRPDESALAILRGEVGLLASLVHELQELSLAESGQLALTIDTIDAVHLAREAVAAIAPSALGVRLAAPTEDRPQMVLADARRVAQVLRNLLRNAITHTPDGGCVTVRVEGRGAVVAIIVEDTGTGIPEEHLSLVFERFHRVDPSRDRGSGGMGLGLAVVRQLVTALGGRVWVESRLGDGSRFGVELPYAG